MKELTFTLCFFTLSYVGSSQWQWQYPFPHGNELSSVFFTSENTGYAVGEYGTIVRTLDGGTNWSDISILPAYFLFCVCFIDKNTGFAVGEAMLKATDGGNSWTTMDYGTSDILFSICFPNSHAGYAAGRNGNIFKTTTEGLVTVENKIPLVSGLKIFPNPSSGKITVEAPFSLKENHISILNLNGQLVFDCKFAGNKTQTDISNLLPGVYFLRL